jgi:hypothetical protein
VHRNLAPRAMRSVSLRNSDLTLIEMSEDIQ